MKEMSQAISQYWDYFKLVLRTEFIAFHHMRRTRDKVHKLVLHSSVPKYMNEFRNFFLTVPNMNDGEKLDKCCAGLKPQVRLEVLKAYPVNIEDDAGSLTTVATHE